MPVTEYTPFNTKGKWSLTDADHLNAQLANQAAQRALQGDMFTGEMADRGAGRAAEMANATQNRQMQMDISGTAKDRWANDAQMAELQRGGQMDLARLQDTGQTERANIATRPAMAGIGFEMQKYGDDRSDDAPMRDLKKQFFMEEFGTQDPNSPDAINKKLAGIQGGGQPQQGNDQRAMLRMSMLAPQLVGPMMKQQAEQKALERQSAEEDMARAIESGDPKIIQQAQDQLNTVRGTKSTVPYTGNAFAGAEKGMANATKILEMHAGDFQPIIDSILSSRNDQEKSEAMQKMLQLSTGMATKYGVDPKYVIGSIREMIRQKTPKQGRMPMQREGASAMNPLQYTSPVAYWLNNVEWGKPSSPGL